MDYFFDQKPLTHGAVCSDPACPCSETSIPVGGGYIYIPREVVDFRRDCPTAAQLDKKLDRISRQSGRFMMFGPGVIGPILMCDVGAKKRGINLEVAQADARHWWSTGMVPLRMTPMADRSTGSSSSPPRQTASPSQPSNSASSSASRQAPAKGGGGGCIWAILLIAAVAGGIWWYQTNGPKATSEDSTTTSTTTTTPELAPMAPAPATTPQ